MRNYWRSKHAVAMQRNYSSLCIKHAIPRKMFRLMRQLQNAISSLAVSKPYSSHRGTKVVLYALTKRVCNLYTDSYLPLYTCIRRCMRIIVSCTVRYKL